MDAARDSARSPRSAAERQARQRSLAWTSPANAQLRRNPYRVSSTPAPLSRQTVRDGRQRRRTSSFCAVWLSSTSGSHAVATPNGRRTRPQQSRARRRWRRHRRRQFSHPRIAVRIRQSPASLPAVVPSESVEGDDYIMPGACLPANRLSRSSQLRSAAAAASHRQSGTDGPVLRVDLEMISGRDPRAGPGACSVYESESAGVLAAGDESRDRQARSRPRSWRRRRTRVPAKAQLRADPSPLPDGRRPALSRLAKRMAVPAGHEGHAFAMG